MKKHNSNWFWGSAVVSLFGVMAAAVMFCAPVDSFAGDEILLGTTSALTGKYAKSGRDQVDGIRLWVSDVNARGGLLGRQVRLVHYDDASSKETCVEGYERLITEDKVDLLIGPYSSGLTMEASLVAEKHNFPMLAGGAASAKIWSRGLHNIFGMYPSATTFMDQILEFAKSKGLKRIAMIYADTVFPRSVINGAQAKAEKEGLEVVAQEAYPNKSTDFGAIITKLKGLEPDVIIGGTYFPDSVAFVRQSKAAGVGAKIMIFTVGPVMQEFSKELGADAEGVLGVSPWNATLNFSGVKAFSENYQKAYGRVPAHHAAGGYGAGQIIEAAVNKAGSLDKGKLRSAFSELETMTVFGQYKLDGTGRQIGKAAYTQQWINGKLHIVAPQSVANHTLSYPFTSWAKR